MSKIRRKKLEVFTYNDYITCIHTLHLNSASKLEEKDEEYNLEINTEKEIKNNIINEIIKKMLENKDEIANIVNYFIGSKKQIKGNDIEKYNIGLSARKYNLENENIIYKQKEKNIFYLIKHQQKLDRKMLYKMLNSCVDIIYSWNMQVRIKRKVIYPIIVPIIIYTGIKKWNVSNVFKEVQLSDYRFENCKVNFKYNLIDVNKLYVKNLIQKNSLFSYSMALAKARDFRELKNILNQILVSTKNQKIIQKELLNSLLMALEKNVEKRNAEDEIHKEYKEIEYMLIEKLKGTNKM